MENRGKKLWLRSTAAKIAIIAIIAFVAGYLFKSLSQHPRARTTRPAGCYARTDVVDLFDAPADSPAEARQVPDLFYGFNTDRY